MPPTYTKIAQLKSPDALRERLTELGLDLPVDDTILTAAQSSPLAAPVRMGPHTIGNRWCIHPMEGWDAHPDGSPSDLTLRRWERIGRSGAKLVWGGEAAAVQPDGRANPRQTLATPDNRAGLEQLITRLRQAHRARFGTTDDLVVGLQLTHSGRFACPKPAQRQPLIAAHHPLLDAKFGIEPDDESVVVSDAELEQLFDRYVTSAGVAREVGFQFVDIKACHGYLLHELLGARRRPGPYGGDFAGRTRALKTIIERVRHTYPDLTIGVRLSVFDTVPYRPGADCGEPVPHAQHLPYEFGFGIDASNPLQYDLREPIRLLRELHAWGVAAVNITCGSPYYCPHIQRPALFPPSDGYQPPEDPLVGVCRLIQAARECHAAVPELLCIGTGYTYLQDYLPHVAQAVVRDHWIDVVGMGRMLLAYPELPSDCLERGSLQRKRICRTFSDCTTAPRHGLVSGCYPLDDFYKTRPDADVLKENKQRMTNDG